jgi:hypothetical protein
MIDLDSLGHELSLRDGDLHGLTKLFDQALGIFDVRARN